MNEGPSQLNFGSVRYVISWFGYDIADHELLTDEQFEVWARYVKETAASMGLRVERFGNPIDLIFGKLFGSVTPREFYLFQRRWDELNERFDLRMSGHLWLMDSDNGERSHPTALEFYRLGRRIFGDSIGRPHRHSLAVIRAQRKRQEAGKE